MAAEPDLEWVMLDATVIRAHAQAAGARQKGGSHAQALGRSRGGFGIKLHVCVDASGLPVRLALGPGQQNDMAPARDLIEGLPAEPVLADRACDAGNLSTNSSIRAARSVSRQGAIGASAHLRQAICKERNRVERFFSRIKHRRRIATRYDKLAQTFMGFVIPASIMLWLK